MGKGDKRGKAKTPPKGIPALAPVVPKIKQFRHLGKFVKKEPDPRTMALIARAHHSGESMDISGLRRASAPWMGEPLGMCIAHGRMDTRSGQAECVRLWAVWTGLCAAERAYRIRILGITGEPQPSAMQVVSERFETDERHSVDFRTHDQKDRDAVSAYMRWRGFLGHLDSADSSVLLAVRRGEAGTLWHMGKKPGVDAKGKPVSVPDCHPTQKGLQAVTALEALADVVDATSRAQGVDKRAASRHYSAKAGSGR